MTADRTLAVVGLAVTVIGVAITLWQLLRTRRAAEAASRASATTRADLRTSDLRRALDASFEIGRRVDQGVGVAVAVIHLNDWLAAYRRVRALAGTALPPGARDVMVDRLEAARAEVLVARDAAHSRASWAAYRRSVLLGALADYGAAAEAFLLAADDERAREHAV